LIQFDVFHTKFLKSHSTLNKKKPKNRKTILKSFRVFLKLNSILHRFLEVIRWNQQSLLIDVKLIFEWLVFFFTGGIR